MLKYAKIVFIISFLPLLTGCLYPDELKRESNTSLKTYVNAVQIAVDEYKKETGVLPIKNSEPETPIFEKYQVNYDSLMPRYLDSIPDNDFAKGGNHLYVLVDVETKPTVKLIDLRVSKKVRNVQQAVNQYRLQQNNKLPLAEEVVNGEVWKIDYGKLNLSQQTVTSPYSNQNLQMLITKEGLVIVDYAFDIYPKMKEVGSVEGDLRRILVDHSYFVPVNSYPYEEIDGEPVISTKNAARNH